MSRAITVSTKAPGYAQRHAQRPSAEFLQRIRLSPHRSGGSFERQT